jgi:hypothetical protein
MRTHNDLFAWQIQAIKTLTSTLRKGPPLGYALAADPGAGKTAVILHVLKALQHHGRAKKTLLIAPRAVLDTVWYQEARQWEDTHQLRIELTHQLGRTDRHYEIASAQADIVTVTTDNFATWLDDLQRLGRSPVDMIVVDESHMFANAGTKRTAALTVLGGKLPIILSSGTLMPNGPINSWAVGRAIFGDTNPWFPKSYWKWRNANFIARGRHGHLPKKNVAATARSEINRRGIALVLKPEDVGGGIIEHLEYYDMSDIVNYYLEKISHGAMPYGIDEFFELEDDAKFEKLRQITQGIIVETDDVIDRRRMTLLHDMVIGAEGPVIIPTYYRLEAQTLLGRLRERGLRVCLLSGQTPLRLRTPIINGWNANEYDVMLCNPTAMAEGVNLHKGGAHRIIWYTNTFSYRLWRQLNARLARTGQQNAVSVSRIVGRGFISIDQIMIEALERKFHSDAQVKDLLSQKIKEVTP